MITGEQKQEYLDFANRILQVEYAPEDVRTISQVKKSGEIECVMVFSELTKHCIEVSVASNGRWRATRAYLAACYRYAFFDCAVRRMNMVVEHDNLKAIAFNERLGHVFEGQLKHWFGEKHGLIYRLLKEECKWLN